MSWRSTEALWLVVALIPLAILALASVRRTRTTRADYGSGEQPGRRVRVTRMVGAGLIGLALIGLVLAVAGTERTISTSERRNAVVIALDTSQSMTKPDPGPSREFAAIAAAKQLLAIAPPETAIGLVTFDAQARLVVSPTRDRSAVRRALGRLPIGEGTALGEAVDVSVAALRGVGAVMRPAPRSPADAPGRVLVITDGVNSVGISPQVGAARAKRAGVPVYTVLIGNDPGRPDQPLPADALAQISNDTGGRFAQSSTQQSLTRAFERFGASIAPVTRQQDLAPALIVASLSLIALAGALLVIGGTRRRRHDALR